MWMMALLIALGVLLLAVVFAAMLRQGKPLRRLFASGLQGLAAIAVVDLVAAYSGVSLGLSWLSLGGSLVLGVPGVITMLLLNVILGIK